MVNRYRCADTWLTGIDAPKFMRAEIGSSSTCKPRVDRRSGLGRAERVHETRTDRQAAPPCTTDTDRALIQPVARASCCLRENESEDNLVAQGMSLQIIAQEWNNSDVASAIVCQCRDPATNRICVPVCVPDSCHPNSLSYISKSMTSITQAQSRSTSISALYAILAPRPNAYPFTSPSCPGRWRGVVGGPPATIAVRGGQGRPRPAMPGPAQRTSTRPAAATRGQ